MFTPNPGSALSFLDDGSLFEFAAQPAFSGKIASQPPLFFLPHLILRTAFLICPSALNQRGFAF